MIEDGQLTRSAEVDLEAKPVGFSSNQVSEVGKAEPEDERLAERVRALAGELAGVINGSEGKQRERLRDSAIRLLREDVEIIEEPVVVPEVPDGFNPFGIAIPVFLAGGVLIFLFPPVGVLLFGVAVVTMVWGVVASLVGRR